jgi:ferric-dicitrate binding protein FerR (iron transport regulator)
MNEEIDIILSRYFSGEASKKELQKLDIWLSESDENEEYFYQIIKLYELTGQTDELPVVDTKEALTQFKTYMANIPRHTERVSVSPANEEIAGQARKDVRITNSIFRSTNLLKYAAAVAIFAIASFSLYYLVQSSKTVQLIAVETQKEYTLFGNANITLFQGAEIVYNKNSNHRLQLKGKAAFNIQSKNSKRLVVQAGETYIEDIGTVFTVDASAPDKSIIVEVMEGEVWFYTDKNSGVYLSANQAAVYDSQLKQFRMIDKQNTVTKELADELIFHNTPLNEAIEIIKTRYNVDIRISSNSLNEILLNASFNKNESIDYILEIITATLSADLSKKNDVYIISSKY